jgi:hypothetical protein
VFHSGEFKLSFLLFRLIPVIVTLAGCQVVPKYVESSANDSAQVRIATNVPYSITNVGAYISTEEMCNEKELRHVAFLVGPAISHLRKSIGMPLADSFTSEQQTEIRVPTDRPLIFSMWGNVGISVISAGAGNSAITYTACGVRASLNAKPNKMYEVVYKKSNAQGCFFEVNRLESDAKGNAIRIRESDVRPLDVCKK